MSVNPIIGKTNVNSWKWLTEQGFFEATIDKYYKTFTLRYLRVIDDQDTGHWENIYLHQKKDWECCKELYREIVAGGIEAFLSKYKIDLSLSQQMMDRFKLPRNKVVKRSINKIQYDIEWSMQYNNTHRPEQTCEAKIKVGHLCTATISAYPHRSYAYAAKKYCSPPEEFRCGDIERGWEQFQMLCKNPKVMLMESLL